MNESEIKDDDDDEKEEKFERDDTSGYDTSRGKLHVFACVFTTLSENSFEKIVDRDQSEPFVKQY